jgi:cytidylate kinase
MTNAAISVARISVAIDGPAGAGKSTVARQVASALDYTYVDTGAMYRAVAWAVAQAGIAPGDTQAVCEVAARLEIGLEQGRVFADRQDITDKIRTPEISNLTSPVSALPCVRERLAALQREMGRRGGIVMEGRDIGTVVLPNAEVKVFLTASQAERVRRRREELGEAGIPLPTEQLAADIAERDARDASRDAAPMVPAADAVQLVSDGLSVGEVVSRILALCRDAENRQYAEARHE